MGLLYVVRHAKAGDRLSWPGDDRERPLTKKGQRQAAGYVERFRGIAVPRLLASPYVRCVQTLEPLGKDKGLGVHAIDVLAEGSSFFDVIELLEAVPDHTVLCSHGDVIPETMAALVRRGMEVDGFQDWRKGATWVIERVDGEFVRATTWPPPADD